MWDLIVSVPDHCLSFYLKWIRKTNSTMVITVLTAFWVQIFHKQVYSAKRRFYIYGPVDLKSGSFWT